MRDRLMTLEKRRSPSPENRPHLIRAGDDKLPESGTDGRPTVKRKDIVE
jgi:hypothetical protein